MKNILINGHSNFGNRGCEALVRSLIKLLQEKYGPVRVYVPSNNKALDSNQFQDFEQQGVNFVPFHYPISLRMFVQFQRLPIKWLQSIAPSFLLPRSLKELIKKMDIVVSLGGDMYTYEGRLPTWILTLDKLAIDSNVPIYLVSSSLSDFSEVNGYPAHLSKHFKQFTGIAVREVVSFDIAKDKLGLKKVKLMPDIAFSLSQEQVDLSSFWPKEAKNGVVGINLSPLVEKLAENRNVKSPKLAVRHFIQKLIEEHDFSVLLIPHVAGLDGATGNNDYLFLKDIVCELGDYSGRLAICPNQLNAPETKYAIANCRFFYGARTHSVIGAISSNVPAITLSYSNKGVGIARFIFGERPMSISIFDITTQKLVDSLQYMVKDEVELKSHIATSMIDINKDISSGYMDLFS